MVKHKGKVTKQIKPGDSVNFRSVRRDLLTQGFEIALDVETKKEVVRIYFDLNGLKQMAQDLLRLLKRIEIDNNDIKGKMDVETSYDEEEDMLDDSNIEWKIVEYTSLESREFLTKTKTKQNNPDYIG